VKLKAKDDFLAGTNFILSSSAEGDTIYIENPKYRRDFEFQSTSYRHDGTQGKVSSWLIYIMYKCILAVKGKN
jgi:hypothetical protein